MKGCSTGQVTVDFFAPLPNGTLTLVACSSAKLLARLAAGNQGQRHEGNNHASDNGDGRAPKRIMFIENPTNT
jgi:hypothetical protein